MFLHLCSICSIKGSCVWGMAVEEGSYDCYIRTILSEDHPQVEDHEFEVAVIVTSCERFVPKDHRIRVCPWCERKHPIHEHHQCAPDAHLEAEYEGFEE